MPSNLLISLNGHTSSLEIGTFEDGILPEFMLDGYHGNSSAYSFAKHGKQAENPSVFSAYLENIFFIFSSISDPVRRMV